MSHAIEDILNKAEMLCTQRGVRLTPQRRIVLELLCRADKPLSAYEILDLLRESTKNPAPPTVYRALDFLLEQSLAHKLESLHAYVGCAHPDHPHASQFLICTDCGEVSELDNHALVESLQSAQDAAGFTTKRQVIELLGTCKHCTRNSHRPGS